MVPISIDDMSLSQLTERWPGVLRVFLDWHLHCIGCPVAPFHTLTESAREHDYPLADLRAAVLATIEQGSSGASPLYARPQAATIGAGP